MLADFKVLTREGTREEGAGESEIGLGTGNPASRRSPQAPAETPANTQDFEKKKANRERLTFVNWWRGAESNASPHANGLAKPDQRLVNSVPNFCRTQSCTVMLNTANCNGCDRI